MAFIAPDIAVGLERIGLMLEAALANLHAVNERLDRIEAKLDADARPNDLADKADRERLLAGDWTKPESKSVKFREFT